jgi:signal transduction histidine kinase
LINEILDLALIESGKLSMSMEPISLPEVLLDCQTMIEPQAHKKGIQMHFPQFTSPCFVQADRTRVKQIVVNLLSNAIKYNRVSGSVEVTCQATANDRLHISVRDTGDGLSAMQLSAVPALQPPGPGRQHRRRHRHWPGGQQTPGGADGRQHWRPQHGGPWQRILD